MSETREHQQETGEVAEGSHHLESRETVNNIDSTFGKELGWFNITSDTSKVIDAQLLNVSGYDIEFVKQHHRVRDLNETVARWSGKLFKGLAGSVDVFTALDKRMPMEIKLLDDDRKETDKKMDLRELAPLIKILEYNDYLGEYGFNQDDLIKKFLAGEDLVVFVPKMEQTINGKWQESSSGEKEIINLRSQAPVDNMKDFSFDDYINKIKKYQIGFQWLGGLKDQALAKSHIENGSHTLFVETGRTTAYGFKEYLWMPTCTTSTVLNSRGDVPKTSISSRAKGHVHEVGRFSEANGTTVEFFSDLLKIHRGEIGVRDHNQTNARMNHAAVALEQTEEMQVLQNKEVEINGVKRKMSVAVIGNSRKGKIYDGMHANYDEGMKKIRGYGITDEEADDLIFSRIIAPFIYNNSMDWLMCFAKAAGSNFGYSPEKAVVKGGQSWSDYGKEGFCVAIPCKDGDPETGLKYFFDFNQLIEYVNDRIAQGDIIGVAKTQKIQEFSGLTEKQVKDATEDSTSDEDEDDEFEFTPEKGRFVYEIFSEIFGGDVGTVLEEYKRNGAAAKVTFGGSTKKLKELLIEQFKNRQFDQIIQITGESGQHGAKYLIGLLFKNFDSIASDLIDLSRGVTIAEKPKSVFDKIKIKEIDSTNVGMADFTESFDQCKIVVGDQPGFEEQTKVENSDTSAKKLKKLNTTEWGSVLLRVAKIKKNITGDAQNKIVFESKLKDAKWLVKEALIQLKKYKLIKDLGL
ncbi:MAG: hypothetical protein A2537_02560 [Candidatus Magasanikbacteria bacterium RIFOXYD2_FULL_36_9]|uniref:Uncharacterized protein n=1 Tax=Candidatus Magasanikbacteria bacterium RIFOXYD2_FULL_36_9 TaxID=1798707 RepID=A0A1F6P1L3_9BACT|nr:MAG: hypothetical protein A2537_02560 [Candidatus Magasanikbacteria bacterium RIFOXYD2_FULL_36_9]